jgi:hypothetical protein
MRQGHWVIGASIVLAAVIVAGAILVTSNDDPPSGESSRSQQVLFIEAQTVAHDRAAQADLRNALVAAKTHYTDGSTYAGFDPEVAKFIEPSLVWYANTSAGPGVISINVATDDDVVLSTKSASGQAFCIAELDEGPDAGTYYGRLDALGVTDATSCTGGW